MSQPQPVTVKIICSMCGLDWNRHGDEPSTEDCIRLLKQELTSRPYPTVWPYLPNSPVYGSGTSFDHSGMITRDDGHTLTINSEVRTPRVA